MQRSPPRKPACGVYLSACVDEGYQHVLEAEVTWLRRMVHIENGNVALWGPVSRQQCDAWSAEAVSLMQQFVGPVDEASILDGASYWQRLRHVIFPHLWPALVPSVLLGSVWTFNMFNVVYLVSGFRWSFYEVSDVSVAISLGMTLAFLFACIAIIW